MNLNPYLLPIPSTLYPYLYPLSLPSLPHRFPPTRIARHPRTHHANILNIQTPLEKAHAVRAAKKAKKEGIKKKRLEAMKKAREAKKKNAA